MNTSDFLSLLAEHQEKELLFEYTEGTLVGTNYHITEVKHVMVDSVDCGAGTDAWTETVVQLWESPSELGKPDYMTAFKALGILKKVGTIKPYILEAELKIEYGNARFHATQLYVNSFEVKEKQLLLKLSTVPTDCKAKEACGIIENTIPEAACSPESGCC
ncbi:DUF6428 family protein [Aquimarina intermedia]|uniref:Uncharacterized protein n=1 Tax=Aquimarina intermedia TaxID=350814 RepID=A0A5S5C9S7_9FLAO|nr:DUF6428 family protein [Aquimarina intermedia]TYP76161.1 hypothetical protein BD809_102378 [Aquimarina intermedia]